MSLNGALLIGRSAINASQIGIQVAGNNMANASTPGYTRQTALFAPMRGDRLSARTYLGNGVSVSDIRRNVDEAVRARIRWAIADEQGAAVNQQFLSQIEAAQNELTDGDLSSGLSAFFNSWSELANNPEDAAVRLLTIQQGAAVAQQINELHNSYTDMRDQADADLQARVDAANGLLNDIAALNEAIVQSENGIATNSGLRDERDGKLNELAKYLDITTIHQDNGAVDVLVNSTPIVLGTEARGIELRREANGTDVDVTVRVSADGTPIPPGSGAIGATLAARSDVIEHEIENLDELAGALIFEVNRLHSQGQGSKGWSEVTGAYAAEDSTAALNSAAAGLPFEIKNGSFVISVVNSATGERTDARVDVDLDGIGTDMSLDDLVSAINAAVPAGTVTAAVSVDGRLTLSAASGYSMQFSDDTSGVLAGLGVNCYFVGEDAHTIAVNEDLQNDPALLATGGGYLAGSNVTALAIAGLREQDVESLGGAGLAEFWSNKVADLAVRTSTANASARSTQIVRESLEAQEQAVSGVSLDEETVQLMSYQHQYEAAARYISIVDQMMQTLLEVV